MYKLIITLLLLIMGNSLFCQNSYSLLFNSSEKDEVGWYIYNNNINNEQVVLLTHECDEYDTSCIVRQVIYTISTTGDTIRWPFMDIRNDTIFEIEKLIQDDNGDYFMVGIGYDENSGPLKKAFNYFSKWDSNHECIWERFHHRPQDFDPFMASYHVKILGLTNGNYLVGMTIKTINPSFDIRYYFIEINPTDGTVVREKVLDLGGSSSLQSLTYNIDSTEVILHSDRTYMNECNRHTEGAVFLDPITYDTLRTFCYNRDDDDPLKYRCVHTPYNAKISTNGVLIVAGTGDCINLSSRFIEHYIFAYKYDSEFNLLERKFLTNPDTIIDAAWFESLDINDNNEIFLAGNHDRGIGPWNSHYNYIYLAKLSQNLELISERYLGGDAYYTTYSMTATSDGGMVLTGTRFDYLVNNLERDAFVIKTDGNLWVGQHENAVVPIHSAIVYPNPGNNQLTIRTTEYPSMMEIYDIYGNLKLTQQIEQRITIVETPDLNTGVFTWVLKNNHIIIDNGKWIKTQN